MYVNATLVPDTFHKFDLSSQTWSVPSTPRSLGFYDAAEPSAEYFPDRSELLWLQGGWAGRVGAYNASTNTWQVVSTALSALGVRSPIARYSPVCHCVLLMGGLGTSSDPNLASHAIYKYASNGSITRMKDAPA